MKTYSFAVGLLAPLLAVNAGARHLKNLPLTPSLSGEHAKGLPLIPQIDVRQDGNGRPTSYDANYFDQKIDHFPTSDRYLPHTNDTFKQTYYVDNTYYKPGTGDKGGKVSMRQT